MHHWELSSHLKVYHVQFCQYLNSSKFYYPSLMTSVTRNRYVLYTSNQITHIYFVRDISLYYSWSPVWLDWILSNKKLCYFFNVKKLLNPNQSNLRPAIQWYFPLLWVFSGPSEHNQIVASTISISKHSNTFANIQWSVCRTVCTIPLSKYVSLCRDQY